MRNGSSSSAAKPIPPRSGKILLFESLQFYSPNRAVTGVDLIGALSVVVVLPTLGYISLPSSFSGI